MLGQELRWRSKYYQILFSSLLHLMNVNYIIVLRRTRCLFSLHSKKRDNYFNFGLARILDHLVSICTLAKHEISDLIESSFSSRHVHFGAQIDSLAARSNLAGPFGIHLNMENKTYSPTYCQTSLTGLSGAELGTCGYFKLWHIEKMTFLHFLMKTNFFFLYDNNDIDNLKNSR